jgi:hypothetical protein
VHMCACLISPVTPPLALRSAGASGESPGRAGPERLFAYHRRGAARTARSGHTAAGSDGPRTDAATDLRHLATAAAAGCTAWAPSAGGGANTSGRVCGAEARVALVLEGRARAPEEWAAPLWAAWDRRPSPAQPAAAAASSSGPHGPAAAAAGTPASSSAAAAAFAGRL